MLPVKIILHAAAKQPQSYVWIGAPVVAVGCRQQAPCSQTVRQAVRQKKIELHSTAQYKCAEMC